MSSHRDIRISFEIKGRRYEAVGFLDDNEGGISQGEIANRTNSDFKAVRRVSEIQFFVTAQGRLPRELRKYYLITFRGSEDSQNGFCCLCFENGGWNEYWMDLGECWTRKFLVLRRVDG